MSASFQIVFSPISARLPFLLSNELKLSPTFTGLYLSIASAAMASGLFLSSRLISSGSSQKTLWLGWTTMCTGLVCMLLQQLFGVACIVAGVIFVQSALGFIIVPCTGDTLSSFPFPNRGKASGLFGFVNAIVSGLSVAFAGAFNITNAAAAIALTATSLILIAALLMAHPNKKGWTSPPP
ncbi:hypothetical protein HNR39_004527 [Glaciimonas immobilis]|uniref:Major facilitator superfamily (MFS) profile domain-containing protein n=1 Tax=Glaciimonas immobilis TaxID=728004 RepID=A0A840RVJ3_9BURK|nr:hypothetical protein [Glaciimonas immobilis]